LTATARTAIFERITRARLRIMRRGKLLFLVLALIANCQLAVAENASDDVLSVLRRGQEVWLSQIRTGKGETLLITSGAYKDGGKVAQVPDQYISCTSAFDQSNVRVVTRVPEGYSNVPSGPLPHGEVHTATDWHTMRVFYPAKKVMEVGPCSADEQRSIQRLLPQWYGTLFDQVSPRYELRVLGERLVGGSSCYVVGGVVEQQVRGSSAQMRVEALVDPHRSYLTPEIRFYLKAEGQNEVVVYERQTELKEYTQGFWAPVASTETYYDALDPGDMENTKFIREKTTIRVPEYNFNIPLTSQDLTLDIPPGTRVLDIQTGIAYSADPVEDIRDLARGEERLVTVEVGKPESADRPTGVREPKPTGTASEAAPAIAGEEKASSRHAFVFVGVVLCLLAVGGGVVWRRVRRRSGHIDA